MLAVTILGLIVIHYARFGDALHSLLADPAHTPRWLPTLWFLGLYQRLQHGAAAPAFAAPMAHRAELALALIAAALLIIYPIAWTRMRRLAIEEQTNRATSLPQWTRRAIHAIIRSPAERAIFHFISQTIARNTRYQVYMALYFGAGLALAISCATRIAEAQRVQYEATTVSSVPHAALSRFGLHAVMPLLVFWTIAGLKLAFAFPLQLGAAWIFRTTGAPLPRCVLAVRKWALGCGLAVVLAVTAVLACLRCSPRDLIVQAICGICLCALLVEGLFFEQATIPFSQPRRPGRTQMPLMLTLHLGVLAPFVFLMILLELRIERSLPLLLLPIALVPLVHWAATHLRDRAVLIEEEREGGDGDFQLLGLAGDLTT